MKQPPFSTKPSTHNKASVARERRIAVLIVFKTHSPRINGTNMKLQTFHINDTLNRMYRRVHKLASKKHSSNPLSSTDFIPSITGYCNTENQPYVYLTLGVPSHYKRLEFARLVDDVLSQCPLVERCTIQSKGKVI